MPATTDNRESPPDVTEYLYGKGKIRLRCTHVGYSRYGNCEVCGKRCEVHWIANAMIEYEPGAYTFYGGISAVFGHRECVEPLAQRKLKP